MIQDWGLVTIQAFQNIWQGFLNFLPKLVGALIVFIVGWFISIGIGRLIAEILNRARLNNVFERTGWRAALEKAEIKVTPSEFIGAICKWVLVIVFLLAAVEILGFLEFADFLKRFVLWLPNLIVAIAIFVVAIVLADIIEKVVKASVKKMGIGYTELLGGAVRWAIYIFATFAILLQLGITPTIINTLVGGFVGMLALALGLAFGLGGKDAAAKLIEEIKRKLSE